MSRVKLYVNVITCKMWSCTWKWNKVRK